MPLALFLLALSQPRRRSPGRSANVSVPSDKATIVLLVDVSGSMRAADVKPTRLGAAQTRDGAPSPTRSRRRVKVGLVSFSSRARPARDPDDRPRRAARGHRPARARGGNGDRRRARDGGASGEDVARRGAARQGRQGARGDRPALRRRADTRSADADAGRGAGAQAGIRVFTVALGTKHGTLGFQGPFGGYGFGGGFGGNGGNNGGAASRCGPIRSPWRRSRARPTVRRTRRSSASKVESVYKKLGSSIAQQDGDARGLDANHGAYSAARHWNHLIGWTADAMLGVSSHAWRVKHNVAHHTYTNVDGYDDGISADAHRAALCRRQASKPVVPAPASLRLAVLLLHRDCAGGSAAKRRLHPAPDRREHRAPAPQAGTSRPFSAGKGIFIGWAIVVAAPGLSVVAGRR